MDSADPIPAAPLPGMARAQQIRLAALMLILWAGATIWLQWGHWPEDLSALYVAGHLWQSGQSQLIYAAPEGFFGGAAASWGPVLRDLGIADRNVFPYVYPPLWAVLLAPLTGLLGPQGFANAVTLVQVPMLAASVPLAARLLRPAAMPLPVWTLLGIGVLVFGIQSYLALWHNQPSITVTFLVLAAFVCVAENRPVAAGATLALAAAIKLTPAAFALVFLIDRQYRALAAFAIFGAALGLLSLALAGIGPHLAFLESLDAIRGAALVSAANVSLLPALMTAGSALGLAPPFDTQSHMVILQPVPGWLGGALSLAALALTAAFLVALRDRPGPMRRGIGLFALSLILALFGPLGWLHYYLLPLFLLPGLFGLLGRGPAALLALAVAIPSLRIVVAGIGVLPWPTAGYIWIACAGWLAVLAALLVAARRRD